MTACDLTLLSRYLDAELTAAERTRLESHLAGCPSCRRELYVLGRVDRTVRAWGARREPIPVTTERRVLASVSREQSRVSRILAFGQVMPAAFGTTIAALLVLVTVNLGPYLGPSLARSHDPAPSRVALEKVSAPLVKARRVSAILGVRPPEPTQYLARHHGIFDIQ